MAQLHEALTLFISPGHYSLVAPGQETLVIDRATAQVSLLPHATPPAKFDKELAVHGVFGIVPLLRSDYLVVVTARTLVADVLGTPVYAAKDFSVFPLDRSPTVALLAHPDEAYLLGLLKTHLFSAPFYFTYGGYNLTQRLQEQVLRDPAKPFFETCDERFFWNKHLQTPLIDAHSANQDLSRFILPVMFGYFKLKPATINSTAIMFGLISRRSRHRAGTRYFSRGIDKEGNVSNFNETEQILITDAPGAVGKGKGEVRFSYVQTRGSVPVYWAEINNLRYKPDLKIMDVTATAESLTRHFASQVEHYGDQYLINLVNQSGYEKPVKEAFERGVEACGNPRVHYTYFDFHHECKGLRFDRVSVLIEGLDEELLQQGYFYQDVSTSPATPQKQQTSVVRTNCMDCLDRTNVVQSALAKWVLNNQLRQIGILSIKESVDEHAPFLHLFRNIWADNADVVSRAYSGTGALKTDYTRTGKRSKEGALQDGVNSVVRYVKNNFLDGPRQDSYDLVTGAWIPRRGQEQDWADQRDSLTRFAPAILAAALTMLVIAFMASELVSVYFIPTPKFLLIALILLVFAGRHILNNGIDYVSHPRLNVLDEVLNYTGKGFESGRKGRPLKVVSVELAAKRVAAIAKRENVLEKVD